jgi:hypothetical protein
MGSLSMLFLALDALEYAPSNEPKLCLSLSMSSDRMPCSAIGSYLLDSGTFASLVEAAGPLLVLNRAFGGAGSQKNRWVYPLVCLGACLKGVLFIDSFISSDYVGVCSPLPLDGRSTL